MDSHITTRRRAIVLAAALTSMASLASAAGSTSNTQVAFSGCLGICVAHNGCGTSNTKCVCTASGSTSFLENVVQCVTSFCLLSSDNASAETANDVIGAIDSEFIEVVATVCAADKLAVPTTKLSSALSSASSLVSVALGLEPSTTRSTVTTHATTTVYRSTQTAQGKTTKTVPRAGATSTTSSETTETTEAATSSTAAETEEGTTTVTASPKDAQTTTPTTNAAKTKTEDASAKDTTDSSPFTNTREDSAAAPHGSAWKVMAAAALPMLLTMGLRLL